MPTELNTDLVVPCVEIQRTGRALGSADLTAGATQLYLVLS